MGGGRTQKRLCRNDKEHQHTDREPQSGTFPISRAGIAKKQEHRNLTKISELVRCDSGGGNEGRPGSRTTQTWTARATVKGREADCSKWKARLWSTWAFQISKRAHVWGFPEDFFRLVCSHGLVLGGQGPTRHDSIYSRAASQWEPVVRTGTSMLSAQVHDVRYWRNALARARLKDEHRNRRFWLSSSCS